jgi:hypothetical protein
MALNSHGLFSPEKARAPATANTTSRNTLFRCGQRATHLPFWRPHPCLSAGRWESITEFQTYQERCHWAVQKTVQLIGWAIEVYPEPESTNHCRPVRPKTPSGDQDINLHDPR